LLLRLGAAGQVIWAQRFGDAARQELTAVAIDPRSSEAALLVAGTFEGGIDLGGGSLTAAASGALFVAKLGLDGAHRWSRSFDVDGAAGVSAVTVDDSGAVALAGSLQGAIDLGQSELIGGDAGGAYVLRLDPDGAVQGGTSASGTGTVSVIGMVADPVSGALYVAGSFAGEVDFGGGPLDAAGRDMFVWALDAAGGYRFARGVGGPDNEYGGGLALQGSSGLVLVGELLGTLTLGGTTLQSDGRKDLLIVRLLRE